MSNKKDSWYRQCKYALKTPEGTKYGVSWIPEGLAKVGKKIYFGKKTSTPDEMWEVVEVWGRKQWSFLEKHRMDYMHQREVSDV